MPCYEVVIELATPLAYQSRRPLYPLCFDALLMWLIAARTGQVDPPAPGELGQIELPLAVAGEKHRFYRASAIWVDRPARMGIFRWNRGMTWTDAAYLYTAPTRSGVNPFARDPSAGAGTFRQWRQSLLLVATPRVRFWFDGNRRAVEDLLSDLTHIGVRRVAGFGKVADIAMRESRADYTIVGPDGFAARPVPVDEAPQGMKGVLAYTSYAPPYWDPSNRAMCYCPPLERWLPLGQRDLLDEIKHRRILRTLESASEDGEPLSEEDIAVIAEAEEDIAQGRTKPFEKGAVGDA
ncbi:hypothetical protein V3F56_06405 [Moorellaceae bacterium AZ2]